MSIQMRHVVYDFLINMRNSNLGKTDWTRKELLDFSISMGYASIPTWILNDPSRRIKRGVYSFPEMGNDYTGLNIVKVNNDRRGRPRKNASASVTA